MTYCMKIVLLIFIMFTLTGFAQTNQEQPLHELDLSRGWKFSPGDNPDWASPDYHDQKWTDISCAEVWESQGFPALDGFAWYRLTVVFPGALKSAALKKGLELYIGRVNDFDQTYLNGHLIGQNDSLVADDTENTADFTKARTSAAIERKYRLQEDDARIYWDRPNVIAVRVFDKANNGGLFGSKPHLRVLPLSDIIQILPYESAFVLEAADKFHKSVIIKNRSPKVTHAGILSITVRDDENGSEVFRTTEKISLKPEQTLVKDFSFNASVYRSGTAFYEFAEPEMEKYVIRQPVPYLQTPKPPAAPKINGPKVYGVRPGSPFLYRIPATGQKPMTFACGNLPAGLSLDQTSGIITGKISDKGDYPITLVAENLSGKDTRTLLIKAGKTLALTPPMGWNSWYIHYDRISDSLMRQAADAMIASGMADYGYQYVNIDDCWMVNSDAPSDETPRDEQGRIRSNRRFPDMKAMTDYIHAMGLKAGLYTSPAHKTCSGYTGSYGHEKDDAVTFAEWGFDFLKYDWCYYSAIVNCQTREDFIQPYRLMWQELQQLDRDIVLNLCQYGMENVWEWGGQYGNSWRTTGDLGLESSGDLPGFFSIGMSNARHWQAARPGAWNDPDYLLIGWVGNAHNSGEGELTRLSPDEQYFYMSLWSLMAAPLIFSGDMRKLDEFTLNVLCNHEVIDVNQDLLGKQAVIIRRD